MKKIISLILVVGMFLPFCCSVSAEEKPFDVNAKSAILMEASTGQVLYSKYPDDPLPPASVTKVMTLLLVMEAIDRNTLAMSDTVTVSEYAASMGGSQVYLEPFEEMTVEDMLKSVVIASANDAAVALAEKVAGSEDAFVNDMNEKAKKLEDIINDVGKGIRSMFFIGDDTEELHNAISDALKGRAAGPEIEKVKKDAVKDGQYHNLNDDLIDDIINKLPEDKPEVVSETEQKPHMTDDEIKRDVVLKVLDHYMDSEAAKNRGTDELTDVQKGVIALKEYLFDVDPEWNGKEAKNLAECLFNGYSYVKPSSVEPKVAAERAVKLENIIAKVGKKVDTVEGIENKRGMVVNAVKGLYKQPEQKPEEKADEYTILK